MIKFLELTEITYYYTSTLQSQFQGLSNFSSSSSPIPTSTTTTILINPEEISTIREIRGSPYNSLIHLKNNHNFNILESPDTIKKQIHSIEFNEKIDKILDK